ncbi:multiple inositol polyphosphate phosphatase 1-like [Phlebotomus argentipes]|uniref:multiple inositol polyphosphate phosphatase 1-like n=1 Tax=Phlebotomus argentipes TaxID=94469 RepID=UPI002893330C|nr:multiple inositol polyphosphate phosphatase 1-like [Phlebotomus argentipes]
MNLLPVIFLLITTFAEGAIVEADTEDYCFATDPIREQVRRFFSKTAYQFVRGNENITIDSGCLPERFWLLSRHGTRLTPQRDTKYLSEKLPVIQREILSQNNALCREDVALLASWKWDVNVTEDKSEFLSTQGWEDLRGLARYFQNQFPALLQKKYSKRKYFFRHTNKQRTQASFEAFAEGLFGSYKNVEAAPIPQNDTLLRPYDFSEEWKEQEKSVYQDGSEYRKFRESLNFLNMIDNVSKRAGYNTSLTPEAVEMLFKACIYDQAWRIEEPSPWCSLFTPNDVKVLEYLHDLEEYYINGGASDINKSLANELLDNFLTHFMSNEDPKVVAFFTHSTTVELFLTALGIAQDDTALMADNFDAMENRKWRTSEIAPFASNLVIVSLSCNSGPRNRLIYLLNERILEL